MIKKFEEFVNEMYSPYEQKIQRRENAIRDFVEYLSELGVGADDSKEIYELAKKEKFIYTPEETENILKRLPGCDSIEGIINAVKSVFFGTDEDLNNWCGDVKCPVVRGINGKLLTGVVFYSETLNAYAADLNDFEETLYAMAAEKGIVDDDQTDWVDNYWDNTDDGYEVDLDKEFGWREE